MPQKIDDLLAQLVERDASDLHLKRGQPPVMRIRGDLVRIDELRLTPDEHDNMLMGMLNEERRDHLNTFKEIDLSHTVPGVSRFRVNMFWQRGHIGGVFRVIPYRIRTIDQLALPEVTKKIALLPRGLVLVTGPTGSGKSTSLAALIDHINTFRRAHVMTIEDPIEYVHADKTSIINQRELATDTRSFSEALRHVMRQNPDVILVGEMRDLETIQLAITAAETGHLVFSTLHTVDAAQTIDRIIDVFPPEQQAQVRTQLAVTIQAVVSQTLVPTRDGKGRIAAFEVMVGNSAVRALIREGKTHSLYHEIQTGIETGMQTLDGHLLEHLRAGTIDYEHALARSSNVDDFKRRALAAGLLEVPLVAVN